MALPYCSMSTSDFWFIASVPTLVKERENQVPNSEIMWLINLIYDSNCYYLWDSYCIKSDIKFIDNNK